MSMIEHLRANQLEARKSKNTVTASLLTTLISEAAMKGKNDGNREATDDEVVATVKKFLTGVNETIAALESKSIRDERYRDAVTEKSVLEALMPTQMSEDDLRQAVAALVAELAPEARNAKSMGVIMGKLKSQYSGQYDGGMASKLVKEELAK